MAADLIDAGVDVHAVYRHVYEDMPYGKLALLARGLANVERYDGGRLTMSALREAVQGCRGCPLYRRATQTVFGEGPEHVTAMFVTLL